MLLLYSNECPGNDDGRSVRSETHPDNAEGAVDPVLKALGGRGYVSKRY